MQMLLNDGWTFAMLPAGSSFHDAENAAYEPVDLPHDWLIWQEDDLYRTADVWYRRIIRQPDSHDPVVILRFDGVYMDCDILLNDELIATHPYGYTAFDVPLTGKLLSDGNVLFVHIRHRSPNSRWYSGSGIFRDVTLLTLPEEHMVPDSLYLREYQEDGLWLLDVSAETAGEKEQPFSCSVYDRTGAAVSRMQGRCKGGKAEATVPVPDAKLWSPENPCLYRLEVSYGAQTETYQIGLRSVLLDPDRGMLLNGQHIKLKGVCLHHDLGALGAAFHPKAARRQLELMKRMGANAVRTSHNPPASAFLDLCDEMGLMVVDEAFDMWERPKTEYDYARFFRKWYRNDVASWIRRDRRHPCVIMWSVGNEIYDMHADYRGTEVTKLLADEVRIHDPGKHAYVTFGCNYMPWEGGQRCAAFVDAVGYNYGEKLYQQHHAAHPDWVIYGSETASVLSSRGIYHFPMGQSIMSDADRQCSALGNSNTSWGAESLPWILAGDRKNAFSLGQFIWSGIDYIGEPTPYHTRSCYFGQADTACFPKDSYYLFQSCWTETKMIHIGVTWDWNPGQMIDVPVMTNCSEAELFLNGRSMGRKTADLNDPDRCVPAWRITFEAGEIRAAGYGADGRILCEDRRVTPGETDHLVLSCEDPWLLSDGWDITFVTVCAVDGQGNPVENARDRIRAEVSGGGRLIGTDNGDSTDPDSYKADCRRLFSGKLLLIIASNGRQENITVRVTRTGGKTDLITIPVRNVPARKGMSYIQEAYQKRLPDTVHARRIHLRPLDSRSLSPDHPFCRFSCRILPENATDAAIAWQVTNVAGIESPYAEITGGDGIVTVRARGDGDYYLRALCMENGCCMFISQTEFSASGFGSPALDPYEYLSAGLYDIHEGEIGTGNEKGVAFARDEESMIGFSCVDFGKTGSDVMTADIFALDSAPYDLEFIAKSAEGWEKLHCTLRYQKPSIWNVYQPQTWQLPQRLTGVCSLSFRMKDKIHLRGFSFEKQQNAWILHPAGGADTIYGDCYTRSGSAVTSIGNNVTLAWTEMNFGRAGDVLLEISGKTKLAVNTVSLRIKNAQGEETAAAADFRGTGEKAQTFRVSVPAGSCTVSFVFLPGSSFDFYSFRFIRPDSWTEKEE